MLCFGWLVRTVPSEAARSLTSDAHRQHGGVVQRRCIFFLTGPSSIPCMAMVVVVCSPLQVIHTHPQQPAVRGEGGLHDSSSCTIKKRSGIRSRHSLLTRLADHV